MSDTTTTLRDGTTEVLVRAAKGGASSAWSAVLQRYERMLRGHVRLLLARYPAPIERDEIVQATFARAWAQIQQFEYKGEGSLRRWLQQLAKNIYLNELRSEGARPERGAKDHLLETAEDERATERERGQLDRLAMDLALADLEEDDREILLMRSDEDLKVSDIAAILECSHETAQRRLSQAMKRLHLRLGGGERT